MPEATGTLSEIRPSRLTDWIEHLRRRSIAAKKGRAAAKRRRAVTTQRLADAERLLADIIAAADVIGHGPHPEGYHPAAYLLLTLHRHTFEDLAAFGSELEDLEDTDDREPDVDDEPSHGADAPELDCCDLGEEPAYPRSQDRAMIDAARARYKPQPEPERLGSLAYATVDPETQRAGKWVMLRRAAR